MITSSHSQKKSKHPSFKRETYRANEAIFDKGDRGDCVYLIKIRPCGDQNGIEQQLPSGHCGAKKDDILDEMALLDDSPRMAAAIAIEPAKMVAIYKKIPVVSPSLIRA
jgi:hypothetical protein